MSKPYDATSKDLIEADPAGWVTFLGCPVDASAVKLVDADVSAITAEADKVIRVDGPEPWLLHVEIQSSRDETLERRLLRYNALLRHRHDLPVASVAVLLRPAANADSLTGMLAGGAPIGARWEFRYEVVRVWERPAAEFLAGPMGLVPLAPLAELGEAGLPGVVQAMTSRIGGQPDYPLAAKLWTASYLLMGLRYQHAVIDQVLAGVMQMEESSTYQAILQRGVQQGLRMAHQEALTEARKVLVRAGEPKLGSPNASVLAALDAIQDVTRVEILAGRIFSASSWDDLLKSNP